MRGARTQWMVDRQRQPRRAQLGDRRRPPVGEVAERREQLRSAARGDHQRARGRREPGRDRRDRGGVGVGGCGRRHRAHGRVGGLGERLPRQAQVDRPARRRHRHRQRPPHQVADGRAVAQLVVPLRDLAQHAALVEHLLSPVDGVAAAAAPARLADRGAPGRQQQRHLLAVRVDQSHQRVRGAHVDVHHRGLRPAGREVVAVRHPDRDVLVQDRRHPRRLRAGRERLDHRREVGARVAEHPVDAGRLAAPRGTPPRRSCPLQPDHDGLGLGVEVAAPVAALSAQAGQAVPAERRARVAAARGVHPDDAGPQPVRHAGARGAGCR